MKRVAAIKRLREATGRSIAQITEALDEAKGDLKEAEAILVKSGELIVDKKSARPTSQGLIEAYAHLGRIGVLVEVLVETDFAAKSDVFKEFVHDLTLQISSMAPISVEELMSQPFVKDESKTIAAKLKATIASVGENIIIKRFVRYQLGEAE